MSTKNLLNQTYKVLTVLLILGISFSSIGGNLSSAQAQQERSAGESSDRAEAMSLTPLTGGTLRFPLVGAPTTLDPALFASGNEALIELQIFEGLTQLDQNGNVIPGIASSWSSPDAIVWTFNLRNDVYFHNWRQVKAGDFYYSWDRAKNAGGTYAFMFDDIDSLATPDDFTLVVTLTNPSATFPARVTMPIFAVIPSEAANTIGTNPVGTGPFIFTGWTANKIFLRRSLNYYDTLAYLDWIEFKFYADINAEWTDFQASKLDLTPIPSSQWNTVKSDPNVITAGTMLMQGYGFDMVFFPDVNMRKAFQRAINRAVIASDPTIWPYDPLPVANGVVSPGKGAYDNSDITIPYDPTESLSLLATAGWTDTNDDGILDNSSGSNLSIVVQDFTSAAGHARSLAIANDLANIGGTGVGAAVTLNTDRSAATVEQLGWFSDYPAPDNDLYPFETGKIFATRINYSSTTFDDHVSLGRETLDETARNAKFHAADVHLILNDAAVIPLYYGSMIPVLKNSNVHDLLFTTQGYSNIPLKYAWLELPTCIPSLVLPEDGALLDNGRSDGLDEIIWDFDWSNCTNATQYHLFVYQTSLAFPTLDIITLGNSSYRRVASGGKVFDIHRFGWEWRVQAYVNGAWGNWSVRTFDVEPLNTDPPNIPPPSKPMLNLPPNGSLTKDYTPRLDWLASTPSPDHYELQLSLDANFTSWLYNETIPGPTSEFTVPADLDPNTKYYWRVRAVNANNESSAWSTTWSFRTAILPPVLLAPADTATLDNRRPTLDWEDVTGATGYKIVISKFANLSNPVLSVPAVGSSFTPFSDLPAKTKLYWRVRATGPNGPSSWSTKWSFTTGNPPSVPVLVLPALNALVKDYTPFLDWNNSTLPANTTFKYYQIQINDSNNFSSPLIDATATPGDIADSDYTPISDLAHNTKFYRRVRAVNTVNGIDHFSAWSKVWYFRVIVDAPDLISPADGSPTGTRKPTFDWTDVANNTGYIIQVSASQTFGTLLLNVSTSAGISTYTPTTNLPAGATLYWRVRAKGPNGPSAWSTKFSFTTP